MGRRAVIGSQFRDALCAEMNNGVTNEYAYVDNPSFGTDTQGALSIWYRPLSVLGSNGQNSMIGYGVLGASNAMIQFAQRYNESTSIAVAYRSQPIPDIASRASNAATTNRGYGNHIFTANAWVHWVVQSDGAAWKHWINGADVGATGWLGGANTGDWFGDISGATRMVVGAQIVSNTVQTPGNQRLNEGCYFNRPLTSGEVAWLYNGGVPRNPLRGGFGADLKSWWRFGDSRDTGSTIYDEIGSNHLTTVNMDGSNLVAV